MYEGGPSRLHTSRAAVLSKVRAPTCCYEPAAPELAALGEDLEACHNVLDKEALIRKTSHVTVAYLNTVSCCPTAGKVLRHCKQKCSLFRSELGGSVCVFKIGYTSNPLKRFASYCLSNFSRMMLLHVTECRGAAQMLEAALIDAHLDILGCRNEKLGGEGPTHHVQAAHFYVYIVGARADLPRPIGG